MTARRSARLLAVALLVFSVLGGTEWSSETPVDDVGAPLRGIVASGRHADLRWPDFPEFRSELGRLYERAAWKPLWLRGTRPTKSAIQLIARLAGADSLGLAPDDYDPEWLGRLARGFVTERGKPPPDQLARFDVGLSIAAVRFASALHRGRISPHVVHAQLFLPRTSLAVEMAVDSLRDNERQGSILTHLQPRLRHYQLLKNCLARYRAMERDPTLVLKPGIPRGVKPGRVFRAAPRLRHLLEATGDLRPNGAADSESDTLYSGDLVMGVKQFQRRQGFEPDGVIGPATAERLGRPFAQRVRQIELALERFRWLPVAFSEPPIIVNIPEFRLFAFRGNNDREDQTLDMNVIVGDAFDTHTPVFAAEMVYMIFRPYWEVPTSIMLAEVGPKARKNPGFLAQSGMVLVDGESERAPALPVTYENLTRIGRGLRVRQLPGRQNALGLLKFVMPNSHDVYMHDTAATGLFSKTRRDFSHGCIRLSDPAAMAAHVLRDRPEWTEERIRDAMEGKDNVRVKLSRPIPVCIVYTTASAREDGDVYFYPDIYGLDAELDRLLRLGYPYPK